MKNKKLAIIITIILLILLIPIRIKYYDGGTKEYRAILYRIIVWNQLNDDYVTGYKTGTEVYYFPKNLYPYEYYTDVNIPHLFVKTNNRDLLKTNRGSYIFEEKVGKYTKIEEALSINPTKMTYKDILSVIPNELIYLEDTPLNILNANLFDINNDIPLQYELIYDNINKTIQAPDLDGEYIIDIYTKYPEGTVAYSFKINIE